MAKQATSSSSERQTAFILFGSTGDLALGKIMPALFSLYKQKKLEKHLVICIGRKPYTSESYGEFVRSRLEEENKFSKRDKIYLDNFLTKIIYISGDPMDRNIYRHTRSVAESTFPTGKISIVAYLAVPQELHIDIVKNVKKEIFSCRRFLNRYLAIEKPFGYDQKSAKALFNNITKHVHQKHIVLVDHYLYKWPIIELEELLKADKLFVNGKKMSRREIVGVHAMLEETKRVEHRLDFYDKVGALRDVGQNHVIQMLLSTITYGGNSKAKSKEIQNLSVSKDETPMFSQYEGYTGSTATETYFKVKLKSKSKSWLKANLYISGGKGLRHNKSGIVITFIGNFRIFVNANSVDKGKRGAYDLLLEDLISGTPQQVSIREIVSSWKLCEEILKKR